MPDPATSSPAQLTPRRGDAALARWQQLVEHARGYAAASKAPATLRAYRSDLADFADWCAEHRAEPAPASPMTIALYLTALADAGAKVSTIRRRVAALSQAHQLAGVEPPPTADPLVKVTMAGIRRTLGTAPERKAAAVTAELRRLLATCDRSTAAGTRDAALLLIGFAGGFRRAELVALDVDDVVETGDGLRVTVRRSKTDPEAQGREVGIPWGSHIETCPVRALRAWHRLVGADVGPLFRGVDRHDHVAAARLTPQSVALVVKRACRRAGMDPRTYAGHSLRSGLATAAAQGGASERAIMRQTGHRSAEVLRRYIRAGTLFEENAAAFTGL